MSDIPNSPTKVQQEGAQTTRPVSESLMFSIGGPINYVLTNAAKVGDVVDSLLSEAAFQSLRDTTWVLMDGRDITGTELSSLTGLLTLPDARATYSRACDNGRGLDPNGEKNPGDYVADQFAVHNHNLTDPTHFHGIAQLFQSGGSGSIQGSSGTGTPAANWQTVSVPTGITIDNQGGPETAPKTVYYNRFIKINS